MSGNFSIWLNKVSSRMKVLKGRNKNPSFFTTKSLYLVAILINNKIKYLTQILFCSNYCKQTFFFQLQYPTPIYNFFSFKTSKLIVETIRKEIVDLLLLFWR